MGSLTIGLDGRLPAVPSTRRYYHTEKRSSGACEEHTSHQIRNDGFPTHSFITRRTFSFLGTFAFFLPSHWRHGNIASCWSVEQRRHTSIMKCQVGCEIQNAEYKTDKSVNFKIFFINILSLLHKETLHWSHFANKFFGLCLFIREKLFIMCIYIKQICTVSICNCCFRS